MKCPIWLTKLTKALLGTTKSAFSEAYAIMKGQVPENLIQLLRDNFIFRCEVCYFWKPLEDESLSLHSTCQKCAKKVASAKGMVP